MSFQRLVACLSLRWKVLVCCAGEPLLGEPLLPSWLVKAESRVKERQGFGSENHYAVGGTTWKGQCHSLASRNHSKPPADLLAIRTCID